MCERKSILDAKGRYREFSRTSVPGKREEIVADTSVYIRKRGVVHRVHSQTSSGYRDVQMTGDPVADTVAIIEARKAVMVFDQRDRGPRPVPKPSRRELSYSEILASCERCGGRGFTEDDWGHEDVCECRQ